MTNLGILLAIDPGEDTGVAMFRDGCLYLAWPIFVPLEVISREKTGVHISTKVDRCVVERPRFYPGKSKVDANDLIVTALRAGILAQAVGAAETSFVCPSDWKGQLPKNVCHNRIRGILSADELAVLARVKDHNVWDAVGIGLHALGRFGR